jgi:hypothetical protein
LGDPSAIRRNDLSIDNTSTRRSGVTRTGDDLRARAVLPDLAGKTQIARRMRHDPDRRYACRANQGDRGPKMSTYGLLSFCAAYVLAVASPGPGVAAVLARSLGHGMRGAPAFIAGFLAGDLIWFGIAAAGLAALAQVAQAAFLAIKYAGALYLLTWRTDCGPRPRNRSRPPGFEPRRATRGCSSGVWR